MSTGLPPAVPAPGPGAHRPGPALLVDIGSTVIKICTRSPDGELSSVARIGRLPGTAPGSQARTLIEQRQRSGGVAQVRVCSSANGGLSVGILGLSRRHSVAAAARATASAGGNVVYSRLLSADAAHPAPHVDVLVLTGGVDGGELGPLRQALRTARLTAYPRDILVWAGADAPGLVAGLPVDHTAANVLDARLRPHPEGLTETIHGIYMRDLIHHKGLAALAGVTSAQIWPTPAVVGLAASQMASRTVPPYPASPFVIVDVGGATTDVFLCAELRGRLGLASAPGESVIRHVFTDLGVAASMPRLLQQAARDPDLLDLASAVDPARARALYTALCEGAAGALTPPAGFLGCLFLALRRLTAPGRRHAELARAASFVITGGAWDAAPLSAIRRVVGAACGIPGLSPGRVLLDHDYQLWAHGIMAVPELDAGRPRR